MCNSMQVPEDEKLRSCPKCHVSKQPVAVRGHAGHTETANSPVLVRYDAHATYAMNLFYMVGFDHVWALP
jgi:hypothetical protein